MGYIEKVTSESRPERMELTMEISKGKTIQVERSASTNALMQKHASILRNSKEISVGREKGKGVEDEVR